jgi:putative heme-binding domain-containing protein
MRTLSVLIFSVSLAAQPPSERNPRTSPADIAAGAKTFRSHCSPCHGMNGEGGRGPNLAAGRFYHGSSDLALFRSDGCVRCHRVNGDGGRLGPDLTQIGEMRSPDYLRRAIVEPNADVPEGYLVVTCRDAAGKKYEGFLMNEDTYSVQFMDLGENLHSFAKEDLREYKVDKISKMPSFKDKLTDGDIGDLVAFLSSLRRPGGSR